MGIPLMRSAAGLVVALLLVLGLLPMQAAWGASQNDVLNGDEAWFQRAQEPLAELPPGDPTCQLPTGCNAAGNATRDKVPTHPQGVLVVAANGGEDDAQTFFNFSLNELPLGAVVTGGTVTMPIAEDREARAVRPEEATMVACLVTGFIPGSAEGGSYKDRPTFDDKICVDVKQDESAETLTYTFSLDRFGKEWASGAPQNGVTVLVSPEVQPPAPNETWRAVFNTSRRHKTAENPDDFPPIVSDLQFKVVAPPTIDVPAAPSGGFPAAEPPPPPIDTSGTSGGFDPGTTTTPGTTTDSGTVPTGTASTPQTAEAPPVDEPVSAEGEEAAAPAAAPPAAVPAAAPGLSPAVWLMPLLALAMAGVLGWSLSSPVELAGQREGAVSKLMRNRRMAGESTSAT